MFDARFEFSLRQGKLALPQSGNSAVFFPERLEDVTPLAHLKPKIMHRFKPLVDLFQDQGFDPLPSEPDDLDVALVHLPRVKRLARHLIYTATRATGPDGVIIVDGSKSQGIDSLIKDLKTRVDLTGVVSKAHGKLAWYRTTGVFDDWQADNFNLIEDGFVTKTGVFSADGIDPASQLLAASLPDDLRGRYADFGAGWGYLTRRLFDYPEIEHIDCIEADSAAIDCARQNCGDCRVAFHWSDATTWCAKTALDGIVMNPPFHHGRAADPTIGQAFIASAARNLAAKGRLFMVANRQLPYEAVLQSCFANVKQMAQNNLFKVLFANRPLEHLRKTR